MIQFTEFLVAASKKALLFTSENLHQCFQYFDYDNDGLITADDISRLFNIPKHELGYSELCRSFKEIVEGDDAH